MWLLAEYEASSLFTLKPATATASGGKTLLVPTPYAIKMALLDIACRLEGQTTAEDYWDSWIRYLTIALRPTEAVVVNNTFIKVLKPRRNPAEAGSQDRGYFQRTISYREYAHLSGPFAIALELSDAVEVDRLAFWLLHINYLGKRGSFIQIQGEPETIAELPDDFIVIDGQVRPFNIGGVLTQLDDAGDLPFSRASIYTDEPIRLGKHRILRHVALPYRLVTSSRGYSYYEIVRDRE